ncbi:hypothetical protein [Halomarina litorea]|uniref:hypothetical protein n=1 Tax=Halomarina litorea TaxID=2961595 RepID=UPI0020C4886A|nr:hypothetical protein [Halomarina sp. BCD28]
MTDPELLRRVDAALALRGAWLVLTVLLACFALMTVNLAVGLLALATVLVGARSYVRARRTQSADDFDPRRPAGR